MLCPIPKRADANRLHIHALRIHGLQALFDIGSLEQAAGARDLSPELGAKVVTFGQIPGLCDVTVSVNIDYLDVADADSDGLGGAPPTTPYWKRNRYRAAAGNENDPGCGTGDLPEKLSSI